MVSLYIENRYIELDKEVQFAITKTFEDITNPTSIINDWSKTVSIPFTDSNNETFGHIYNPDRITLHNSTLSTGLYFNPLKKLYFRLEWDNTVLMSGYAKMTSVTKTNGTGRYNLTLNGELGKVFQEMKKITFDTSTEDTNYLIDGSKYVEETINKDLVYRLWNNEPDFENLNLVDKYFWYINSATGEKVKVINIEYKTQNYLGFAPNNSYNDEFDYKTFQKQNENASKKFEEVLDDKAKQVAENEDATYQSVVGIAADTVIGEGLLPREIGEYRSYMQLPYIYFNKLFQIFTKKTEEITGYKVELDNNWFNFANPYWSKLVYMLKQFNTNDDNKNFNSGEWNLGTFNWLRNNLYTPSLKTQNWVSVSDNGLNGALQGFQEKKFDRLTFNTQIPIKMLIKDAHISAPDSNTLADTDYLITPAGFTINVAFRLKNENGVVVNNLPVKVFYSKTVFRKLSTGNYELNVDIPFGLTIDRNIVGDSFTIEAAVYTTSPRDDVETMFYCVNDTEAEIPVGTNIAIPKVFEVISSNSVIKANNNKRSNSKFTLNDLWNNEVNLFDEILNYCKQYRIGVFCNDVHKTLIFKPLNIYFADYEVIDWTDKLDISKNYTIQPITFDNKYVLFNYENSDIQLNKSYNESFGTNYGEYKLITEYEFNNDEKKLFNNVHNVITSTDNILNWEDLYTKTKVVYTLPAELYVSNKDKDKKNISVFGSMLFFNGIVNFDTEYDLRPVKISDDTNFQTLTQTYFYSQDGEEGCNVRCDKYPLLDIVYYTNLCLFNTPMENYTYIPNHYDNTKGIYTNFWKQYLDERYNTNNKIVTCYLDISPTDYMNFEFNKFIKIENQLYMLNKIYDYDITSNSTTKVDLITIQDIEGYTTNNFEIPLPPLTVTDENGNEVNGTTLNIGAENGEKSVTVYVSSNEPVEADFHDFTGDISDVEINNASVWEIYNGYDNPPILPKGINVPLTISTLYGGGDFEIEMYLKTQSHAKSFIVKCVW